MTAASRELPRRPNGDPRPYFDRGTRRWKVAVELEPTGDGRRVRKIVSAQSPAEARTLAQRTREQLSRGVVGTHEHHTVASYLSWWADVVLPGTVSWASEDTYRWLLRSYLIPNLGRIPMAKLAPGHVTEMLRAMERQGLAPATRNAAKKVLGRALRRAMQEELVHRNVAYVVDGDRVPRPRRRSLDEKQARVLLAALAGDRLFAAYLLALALGLRRGEVLGLSWSDVDLEGQPGTLTVRRQLQRRVGHGLVLGELKTSTSQRTLALPQQVTEALRRHRTAQARERLAADSLWLDTGLVFTSPTGSGLDPSNFRRHFCQLAQQAGLGALTLHELRHSAGSLLFAAGVPMKVISETLGHSSERVTSEVYVHLQGSHRQVVAEAMGHTLFGSPTS